MSHITIISMCRVFLKNINLIDQRMLVATMSFQNHTKMSLIITINMCLAPVWLLVSI